MLANSDSAVMCVQDSEACQYADARRMEEWMVLVPQPLGGIDVASTTIKE